LPTASRQLVFLALLAGIVALLSTGCFRYQTRIPGVIDLRTDGAALPPDSEVQHYPPEIKRDEATGIIAGKGLVSNGHQVRIEDRSFWVLGLIPIYNQSIAEELQATLNSGGSQKGLRKLTLKEEVGLMDVGLHVVVRICFGPASWLVPTWTMSARAERVRLKGFAPAKKGPKNDAELPPDEPFPDEEDEAPAESPKEDKAPNPLPLDPDPALGGVQF
jgi:hypothetical protein